MKTKLILTFLMLITISGCKKDVTFDYLKERLVGDWHVLSFTGAPYYREAYMGIIKIAENGTYSANFSDGWFNAEGTWCLDIEYGTSYKNKEYNDYFPPGCSIEIGGARLLLRYSNTRGSFQMHDEKGNLTIAVSYTELFMLENSNTPASYHLYRVEN